jgi:hypothetical protein
MGESAFVWGFGKARAGVKRRLNWPRIRRGCGG